MESTQESAAAHSHDNEVLPTLHSAPQPPDRQRAPQATIDEATKGVLDRFRADAAQDADPMAASFCLITASVLENQFLQEQALARGTACGALPSLLDDHSNRVYDRVNRGRREACRFAELAMKLRDRKNRQ